MNSCDSDYREGDWGYCTSGNRSQQQNFGNFPCDFNMHLRLRTLVLWNYPENKAGFPTFPTSHLPKCPFQQRFFFVGHHLPRCGSPVWDRPQQLANGPQLSLQFSPCGGDSSRLHYTKRHRVLLQLPFSFPGPWT